MKHQSCFFENINKIDVSSYTDPGKKRGKTLLLVTGKRGGHH